MEDKKYDLHDLLQNLRDQQSNKINPMIISIMEQKFFGKPRLHSEKAYIASQAVGPLVKWVLAQIKYAKMSLKVEPLKDELKSIRFCTTETNVVIKMFYFLS